MLNSQSKLRKSQVNESVRSSTNYARKSQMNVESGKTSVLIPPPTADSKNSIRSKVNVDKKSNEKWANVTIIDGQGEDETASELLNHLEMASTSTFEMGEGSKKSMTFGGVSAQMVSQQGNSIMDENVSVSASFTSDLDLKDTKEAAHGLPGLSLQSKPKEIDPSKLIHISLTETNTIFMLSIPSVAVCADSIDETMVVKAQNAKYKELKSVIQNNDNYISRSVQTFETPTKSKEVQATAQKFANAEVMVNQWTIYDAFNGDADRPISSESEKPKELEGKYELGEVPPEQRPKSTAITSQSVLEDKESNFVGEGSEAGDDGRNSATAKSAAGGTAQSATKEPGVTVGELKGIMAQLSLMEKAVVGNNYEKRIISYRNAKDDGLIEQKRVSTIIQQNNQQNNSEGPDENREAEELSTSNLPTIQMLWSYRCDLSRGRHVTNMSWNKQNEDILAVAYSESRFQSNASPGLILCWSAKNPEWPDRIYYTNSPVTSIDFSNMNPGLLAAGFQDGRIIIYDVRQPAGKWALDDTENNGKHRDPVWELKWVERERVAGDEQSKGETLVSVSTDGRVTQWMIRKGLEFTDLMVLKRMTKQKTTAIKSGATMNNNSFIARQTGGLCFDFNTKDSNIYIVGTEDGQIHKCSCSYNEQYLNTYSAHTGPVNKVKWSPFVPGIFLSCSSDWTSRLWNQDSEEEIFKFQSGKDTINDIAWSPLCSTFFGTVSANGKLEIWDLEFSVLDPIINHNVLDRQLTSIAFASKSPIVITGDDYGAVALYKICKNTSSELEATCSGIVNPLATGDPNDEAVQQWRQEQVHALSRILNSKIPAVAPTLT
ncbi:WD repeat-containing protein 78 [Boothiomyces macroporosus]|uniref:Dynein axonemal intermediate chain 4 n=1 Tax=Boothiomyces macroporosus TaxID=261099 RepID=A0AAD5UH97_9FUNG|nr:WD repeat-containing protein 78 [Boothiomyces macroporosus]KAJ3257641.1 WD repeat-containing protein 78 [Boothiomyces macroporosus]